MNQTQQPSAETIERIVEALEVAKKSMAEAGARVIAEFNRQIEESKSALANAAKASQQPPAATLDLDRWRAERGGEYWYNKPDGDPICDRDHHDEYSNAHYRIGNYYRSREAAEQAQARHSAMDWLYEMTERHMPDGEVANQGVHIAERHHCMTFCFPTEEIRDAVQRRATELGFLDALRGSK
jgi:cell pole-organizing protein PopZ